MIIPDEYKNRVKHFKLEFNDEFDRTDVDIPFCILQLEEMIDTLKDFVNTNPPKYWYDFHGIALINKEND